eukprot:GFKZ01001490.1.p1 GENE.GFKZ01001490.1~~GFKZ01001490.1.p1  ORF type:complete len:1114 (+),score=152.67 GFKZ01001490.1:234-3575(+)
MAPFNPRAPLVPTSSLPAIHTTSLSQAHHAPYPDIPLSSLRGYTPLNQALEPSQHPSPSYPHSSANRVLPRHPFLYSRSSAPKPLNSPLVTTNTSRHHNFPVHSYFPPQPQFHHPPQPQLQRAIDLDVFGSVHPTDLQPPSDILSSQHTILTPFSHLNSRSLPQNASASPDYPFPSHSQQNVHAPQNVYQPFQTPSSDFVPSPLDYGLPTRQEGNLPDLANLPSSNFLPSSQQPLDSSAAAAAAAAAAMSLSNANLLAPFQSQQPAPVDFTCANRIPEVSGATVSQVLEPVDPPAPDITGIVAPSPHTVLDAVPNTTPTTVDAVASRSARPSVPLRIGGVATIPVQTEPPRSDDQNMRTSVCGGSDHTPVLTPRGRDPKAIGASADIASLEGEVRAEMNEDNAERNVSSRTSTNVAEDIPPPRSGLISAPTIATASLPTQPQTIAGGNASGNVGSESIAARGRGAVTQDVMVQGAAIRRVENRPVKADLTNETGPSNNENEIGDANVAAGTTNREPPAGCQVDECADRNDRCRLNMGEKLWGEGGTGQTEVNGESGAQGRDPEEAVDSRRGPKSSPDKNSEVTSKGTALKEIVDCHAFAASIPEEAHRECELAEGMKSIDDDRESLRTKNMENHSSGERTKRCGEHQQRAGREGSGYRQVDVSHTDECGNRAKGADSPCSAGESGIIRARADVVNAKESEAINERNRGLRIAQTSKSDCKYGHERTTTKYGEVTGCAGLQEPTTEKNIVRGNGFELIRGSPAKLDSQVCAGSEAKDLSDTILPVRRAIGDEAESLRVGGDSMAYERKNDIGCSETKHEQRGSDCVVKNMAMANGSAVSKQYASITTSATMQCPPTENCVEKEAVRRVRMIESRGEKLPARAENQVEMPCDFTKTKEVLGPIVATDELSRDTEDGRVKREGSSKELEEKSQPPDQSTEMTREDGRNKMCNRARNEMSRINEMVVVHIPGPHGSGKNGDVDYRPREDKDECGSGMIDVGEVGQEDGTRRGASRNDCNDGVGQRVLGKRSGESRNEGGMETRMTRKRRRNAELVSRAEIGDVVSVYWEDDKQFYEGVIRERKADGRHRVVYFDGDVEELDLGDPKETWRFTHKTID